MWVGFFSEEVMPSPKFHRYVGAGLPVEVFVNDTVRGMSPEVGLAEAPATGTAQLDMEDTESIFILQSSLDVLT